MQKVGLIKKDLIYPNTADFSKIFDFMAKFVLTGLLLSFIFGLLGGVGITFYHLKSLFEGNLKHSFRILILDSLTVHALIEVFKTALLYFKEGRVLVNLHCRYSYGGDINRYYGFLVHRVGIYQGWIHDPAYFISELYKNPGDSLFTIAVQ